VSETTTADGTREGFDPLSALPYLGIAACYFATIVGGLVLVDEAAVRGLVLFENEGNVGNVGVFAAIVLAFTAVFVLVNRYDVGLEAVRAFMVLAFGGLVGTAFVLATGVGEVFVANAALAGIPSTPIPLLLGGAVALVLWFYPEWYVIDAVAIVAGAAAIPMFGLSFGPLPAVVLLVVWAGYDAYAVYGSGHMTDVAESAGAMKLPILFVVPTARGFSLVDAPGLDEAFADDEGDGGDDGPTDSPSADGDRGIDVGTDADADRDGSATGDDDGSGEGAGMDAMMLGLGDALIPGMLAVSAGAFLPGETVVPALSLNLPALGALLGGLVGVAALLFVVSRYEGAHAGLPPLNAGVLGGYLVGTVAAGVPVTTALGI
jgi:presenilin-like A22 family membrane protease